MKRTHKPLTLAICFLCVAGTVCATDDVARGEEQSATQQEPCCFENPRFTGTCQVTPGEGETCSRCVDTCPFPEEAVVIREGYYPRIDPAVCTGCGLCVEPCPGKAIYIVPA